MEAKNPAAGIVPVRANLSELEAELIQDSLDETTLKTMRALFFNIDVTEADRTLIKSVFTNDVLRAVMWKRFLPSPTRDTPLGQVSDVWLGAETMIFDSSRDTIAQAVGYKAKSIEMTATALNLLKDPHGPTVDISVNPEADASGGLQIGLLARNQYMRHIEGQLQFLWMIVEQKPKGPKAAAKSSAQDGSK